MKKALILAALAGALAQATAWGAAGVPAAIAIVTGNNQSGAVNTAVGGVVCVQVKDAQGTAVSGIAVTYTVASGGGSVTGATPSTDGSGLATLGSWTLGTAVGGNTLTVTCGSAPAIVFSATATAGPPAALAIVQGNQQSATVNTTVSGVVCVQVKDAFGNVATGVTATFAVASGGGSVTGASPSTDGSGLATLGTWKLGTLSGGNSLTVTCGAAPAVTFTATATPGEPATLAIVAGDGQNAAENTAVPAVVCAGVKDQFANNVADGTAVVFAVASGGGSITGGNATTSAGIATLGSWTLGASAGTNTLSATSGTAPAITFTATATAPAASDPAKIVIVTGNNQSAAANANVSGVCCVKVTDSTGKIVAVGTTVTYTVVSGGGTLTGATPGTDASGIATLGSWKLGPAPGIDTLTASCGSAPAVTFTATATGASGKSGPVIVSPPVAQPSPTTVGTTVSFSVAASGTKLTYTWDFGDGTSAMGATVTHPYSAPGTYAAGVSVSDGADPAVFAPVSVVVGAAAAVVGSGPDSDGDGFSDAFETAVHTDPSSASSTPTGQPITAATLQALTLKTASIKLNFAKASSDTIAFSGTLNVPMNFNPADANVYFDVGGVPALLTLNAKGTAVSGGNSVKIQIKAVQGMVSQQMAKFTVTFKAGNFAATLVNSGLTNNSESGVHPTVPFTLIFNNTVYQVQRMMTYTALKGKNGTAK